MPAAQRPPPPPPLLLLLPTLLLICCLDEAVRAGHVAAGGLLPSAPGDNGFSTTPRDASSAWPTTPGRPPSSAAATAESGFSLKVLVRDRVTRQLLPGATVGLCVNHTVMTTAQTGAGGEVLLWVLYSPGLSLTLVGQMEGYVPSPLPWSTTKRPIFSSVTILLLPQSQGNIWLFEDSVLITAKLPDSSSQPMVKFPKNLLTNSDNSNISSVTAYLTVPQYQLARDCVNCTPGVILNKSVLASVELKPVVAISVLLYSGGEELEVRGPIQVSIPLGHNSHLQASDTIPAWAFNLKTGAWENQGLGIVTRVREELVWTYTASHLGNWIAAPLPSSNDQGYGDFFHFMSYQTYLLVGLLGATLVVVIGFFCLMLCHCRRSHREPRRRKARFSKLTVLKKDQTTSTHMEEVLLFHHGENSLASCSIQCETLSTPRHKANFNIYVEDPSGRPSAPLYENLSSERMKGQQSHYINSEEVARIREKSEQNSVNLNSETNFFQDKLVHICNQPVAIIQASDLFASQEQQMSGCKSNTFPRNGGEYDSEPGSKDTYTQTLPKHHHSQDGNSPQTNSQDDPQPLETPPQGPGPNLWGRYNNLLESSVSVPGTLNEAAGMERFSGGHGGPSELQGISERTLLELTRGKSHARAWFVSLDGKPAAQVRHSIIELQGRHRPHSSNDTSLDSGVDMNEPLHSIREQERDRPSIRASSLPFHGRGGRYNEDPDLSSSESGNTATCTPEDFSLRNILDGSSGAIPNIPEERDGMDTSSAQEDSESRGTPPPRRLRKVREKGKSEKRSAKHVRDGRHLSKRS